MYNVYMMSNKQEAATSGNRHQTDPQFQALPLVCCSPTTEETPMTQEQKRVLLHKHCTGEFPGQKWATVQALLKAGMLAEVGKNLEVTAKGREFCDANHSSM